MVEIGIGKVKRSSFSAAVEHVYTCCCGVFHVKSAVLMVASIFVMLPFLLPLQYLFYRKNLSDETMDEYRYTHMFIFEVGTCLSQAFCALLVFAAIRKEKKKLLLPFLYSQYFAIAFTIALTLVIIFDPQTWFKNIEKYEGVSTSVMISTSIVASVFHSLVRFWIAGIVKKAYQYLADMEKASKVEKLPRF